jgi:capsular polysaccharide biosynthesis protein
MEPNSLQTTPAIMTNISENPVIENPPKSRCCKCSILAGFVFALIAAVFLYQAFPPLYKASATIQIRSEKQQFLFDVQPTSRYDDFVNTQLALIRSPMVINKALEDPEVAKLPVILKQKNDKRGWLRKQLRVKRDGNSEIVVVSIKTDAQNASENIVNAVVENYLKFTEDKARETNNNLISDLQVERRTQSQVAVQLQESIRLATRQSYESLGKDVKFTTALLESLPQEIAAKTIKLTTKQVQCKALEEQLEKMAEGEKQDVEAELSNIKRAVREQEMLVTELTQLYNEQLKNFAESSESAVGVAFDRVQLARIDKTIDQIDDRILAIKVERRALSQITPLSLAVSSPPNPAKQFIIAGVGAIVVFFATLVLGRVLCCCRGRKCCCGQG